MPSVDVSPQKSKPTHDLALSWQGNIMGFNLESGEQSLVATPASPPPSPFQWKQSTWGGGRGKQRSIEDQTSFFDSGSMWTLTPETAHPAPQWGHAIGLITSEEYNPPGRSVMWRPLISNQRYAASSITAGNSFTVTRIYAWIRKIGNPGTLTAELWSNSAGSPNAMLKSVTLSASSITDTLSIWNLFTISGQAVVSATAYWIVLYGASGDNSNNHWRVGADASPATFSKCTDLPANGWTTVSWKMYFRMAVSITRATAYPFTYYGAQFVVFHYTSNATSLVKINGDLGKASAATSTTITKTASGGLTWATNQLAGATIRIVSGTGAGSSARTISSHTSGTTPVFTVSPAWDETPDSTSIFIIYATPYWSTLTSPATGLGSVQSAPAVAGQIVYFPQGPSVNVRAMYFDESTGAYVWAADSTNKADFVHALNDVVYKPESPPSQSRD